MKKKLLALSLALAMLSACASTPSDSIAATPTPTEAPAAEPTPEPTSTPSQTPAPTMAVYDEVSFDDWRAAAGCTMPDYTFSAPHVPQPLEKVAWPAEGVTLRMYVADTLEEAAELYHTTVETLKELNPDYEGNYTRNHGQYRSLKLQAEPYTLPMNNVVSVTVSAPWVENQYDRTGLTMSRLHWTNRRRPRWLQLITSSISGAACTVGSGLTNLWTTYRSGCKGMQLTVRSTQSSQSSTASCTGSIPMPG